MNTHSNKYQQEFDRLKCCVLIPTYNNSSSLQKIVEEVLHYTQNLIVVNDGSTDDTANILKAFSEIKTFAYPNNKGKGYALRYGFKQALLLGYEYAISIDSDGQHLPSDLPKFLTAIEQYPQAIIIGSRNMKQENIPGKSSFGNKFSNFWIKLETGYELSDTQSGFRLYPIKKIQNIRFFTRKFEFEVEVLTRSAWKNILLVCIPIQVYYPPENERVSHFRPFKDFTRISLLNTYLVTLTLLFYLPKRLLNKWSKKSLKQIIKEDIFGTKESNKKIAQALGFGVFMGILPIWGYQLIVGFFIAHKLKLNKGLFFIAANISLPPLIPIILFISYLVGGYILPNGVTNLVFSKDISFEVIFQSLFQYIFGAVVFAVIAGSFTFGISYLLLFLFRNKK